METFIQRQEVFPVTSVPARTIRTFDKKIFLALPWQKHVSPITAFCVAQLHDKRRTISCMNFGDAFVAHSRGVCADLFLSTDCEYMLTIDDDMLVPHGDAVWYRAYTGWKDFPNPYASFNAIDRLLSHGKSLVGGVYWGKYKNAPPVYAEGNNPKEKEYVAKAPHDVCKSTRWVGTGCMLIHRTVFEDIEKKFPRLARRQDGKGGQWFTSSEHHAMDWLRRIREELSNGPLDGSKAHRALQMIVSAESECQGKSSLGMGEDVTFCVRAKESGHQPHVDLGLVCGHVGAFVYGRG
jgi:hypothetical protein